MKWVRLSLLLAGIVGPTLVQAEDLTEMISRYRREHGLSAVKVDPELMAVAERQAKAMAASGVMDHSVAGSFSSRLSGAHTGRAGENLAEGTKTWADTFRMWQESSGHNANLLLSRADSVGFAVARNDQTRFKTYWAMVIAEKLPKEKTRKASAETGAGNFAGGSGSFAASGSSDENPISTIKNFVCRWVC